MAINHALFVKYSLKKSPSDQQVEQWVSLVEDLVLTGASEDIAGEIAAKQVFPDYNSTVNASVANNTEGLLAAAKNGGKNQRGS